MKTYWYLLFIALATTACLKKKELSDKPLIGDHRMEISPDSAIIYLNFTDGDGNFGLNEEDTFGIFAICQNKYNLIADYFEQENGVWNRIELDECTNPNAGTFNLRVPWVKPTGQNQTQEGEIKVVMEDWYLDAQNGRDTIKFEVKIVDRDLNVSNTVVLGPFTKQ
jgi:hypothetical protein